MEKLFDKLSLYDVLTSLFTGSILVWSLFIIDGHISQCCCQCCQIRPTRANVSIIDIKNNINQFIFLSYFCGLLWHRLIEGIFSCDCKACSFLLSPFCRNQSSLIRSQFGKFAKIYNIKINVGDDEILKKYYNSYYRLMNEDKLGNVPKLEASSALAKDLIFVLLLFSTVLCLNGKCTCHIVIVSLLIEVALFAIRYSCEAKIHYLIWEQDYFLHKEQWEKSSILTPDSIE